MKSDLIIIGAGPGGYETAVAAAKRGMSVVIVEEKRPGGTCLNVGCIPTKALCKNASILEELKEGEEFGLTNLDFTFDFKKVQDRKNKVVEQLVTGVEYLLKNKLITYVQGKAQFKDQYTIVVDDQEYTANKIIIATGSQPKIPPINGINISGVITSTELLSIDHIPANLTIIGAGVIGLEFASIFNSFGSNVTVLEYCKEILPGFDTDISKRLKQSLNKKGINIINQAGVEGISVAEGGMLEVSYKLKDTTKSVLANSVLVAVGRKPNVESLNLDIPNVLFTPKGITTNDNLQTNIPHIYAIGDVNGKCMLAHAASFQGIKVLNHIEGKADNIRLDIMPAAVFTSPEAASVGFTEEQCKTQGIPFKTKKSFFRTNGKALSMNEPEGMCKIIVCKENKIIGCHLFGAHAADLVQEVSALICKETSVDELSEMIHAHPTLTEVIQECAREFNC